MTYPSPSNGSSSKRRFQPIDTLISSLKIVERETPAATPPAPNDPVRPIPPSQLGHAGPSAPRPSHAAGSSSASPGVSTSQERSHLGGNPLPRAPPAAPPSRRAYGQSLVSAPASFTSTLVAASRSLGPINQDVPEDEDHRSGNSFVREWGYEDDDMRRLFEEARMAMELEADAEQSRSTGPDTNEPLAPGASRTTIKMVKHVEEIDGPDSRNPASPNGEDTTAKGRSVGS